VQESLIEVNVSKIWLHGTIVTLGLQFCISRVLPKCNSPVDINITLPYAKMLSGPSESH